MSLLFLAVLALEGFALIQTDIVYGMDDAYVNSSSPTTNYDDSGLLAGKAGVESAESWFRFDLSDPSGYYVTGAEIWTYVYDLSGTRSFDLFLGLGTSWTESNLTWNTKPSTGGILDSNTVNAVGWWNWDITSDFSARFSQGTGYAAYLIMLNTADFIYIEDTEDSKSTGNVPYLNLTMMIPETYLLTPANGYTTDLSTITFQYNTTDAGNITNCSILLNGVVNKTNTSVVENSTASFIISGLVSGDYTWAIRCYDHNRYVYEMNPETRNFTVFARVEWYNPDSGTPLDIGSADIGAAEPSGTRQVYSNNSNDNVQVSCGSGDCGVITANWSVVSMSDTEVLAVEFNCSTASGGSFQADFDLTSDQDPIVDTLSVNCSVLAPDMRINSTNITFSDNAPSEGDIVTVSAGVYNDGTIDSGNFVVRFYEGYYSLGNQVGGDHTISIAAGESSVVQENWTASVGEYDIYVVLDPPIASNGSIAESDETNNFAFNTVSVSMWTIFVGNVTGSLGLQTAGNSTLLLWDVVDTTDSLLYVVDTDSSPDFSSLVALSRNTTGSYMSDDFVEFDSALNTTANPDSVNLTFTSGGSPVSTSTFTAFGVDIDDVPTVDSTDYTTFVTGILWDSDDDSNSNGQFDNTSMEDVVFVTRVNQSKVGKYGTYDYEVKVPARLKNYKGPDVLTVTFYAEIK
ncbi:DNRLRE domain-containing protein [Nanoarchaeota archaeon]